MDPGKAGRGGGIRTHDLKVMSLASCRCSIPVFLLDEMGGERFTDGAPAKDKSPEGHPSAERIGYRPMSIERVGNAKQAFLTVTRKVPRLWLSTAET